MSRSTLLLFAAGLLVAAGPPPMPPDQAGAYLQENGIDPMIDNLQQHILTGDVEAVDALVSAGVDVNARSDLPQSTLELAAMSCSGGRTEPAATLHIVGTLLNAGADPNTPGMQGLGPLMIAAQQCDGTVVKRLVAAGAKLDSRTPQGFTPLSMALVVKNYGAAEALLESGARLDPASGRKLTEGSDDARLKALVDRATGV